MTNSPSEEPGSQTKSSGQEFVFVTCNLRSQQLCKKEIAKSSPQLLPSYSRPGFLTYKTSVDLPARFDLPLTFARTFGWSLDQVKSASIEHASEFVRKFVADQATSHVHVWPRDWIDHVTEPLNVAQVEVNQLIENLGNLNTGLSINRSTNADEKVVDVVRIDPGHWWVGWHIAGSIPQRWPGGIPLIRVPESMVSRAYLKTSEALMWSGIKIARGDVCAEIGSAPGGSCQRLLELGATVIAIDPADLDPSVAKHKRVTHLKMRGRDVPHRNLSNVAWLLVDSIVAPKHTLDTVEALTQASHARFRGLLLTLKFTNPDMVEELESYVQRVRSWGFSFVKTRQLAYGRQEICLMALKQKSVRRFRS